MPLSSNERALTTLVARALAVGDAGRCFEEVLAVLAMHGITLQEPDDTRPSWLTVQRAEGTFRFHAGAGAQDESTRELLHELVCAAWARNVEADERARLREHLDMLSAASFEGIMIHADTTLIEANQAFVDMFGYTREEAFAGNFFALVVAPEDQALALERITQRIEGGYLITGIRKDGTRFRAEVHSKQGKLGARPVRVVAIRDVTERERTNTLLREAELRMRDLVEATFDYLALSRGGVIVDAGGKVEEILGVTRQEAIGKPILEFMAPAERARWGQVLGEERTGVFETVALSISGEAIPVEVVAVRTTLNGEAVRLTGIRDLRQARRIEEERQKLRLQVERGERLQSLGVLAGGIAHDFNNLLVGVIGNAELLELRLAQADDIACCQAIRAAGERGAALTRQLLAYAGKSAPMERDPVDISALLRELRGMLDATLSRLAVVELRLSSHCVVLGERTTLMQVFMNLITNASDALLDQAGAIDISVSRLREPGAEWRHALGAAAGPGDWVLVQVRDTGIGMNEATVAHVFEPFFSTKAQGHGLGLAACLGIIAGHGGAIRVETRLGAGTCFSVLLPAVNAHEAPPLRPPASLAPKPCKVLVVDDDPVVRAHMVSTLSLRDFVVVEACDGASALACYRQVDADLLIVDFSMPDMNGAELVCRLRAAGLNTPILLSSGHVESDVLRGLPPGAVQGVLHKPYGPRLLLAAIERVLHARTAGV